jgi:divalent metal cation (Fe/Co/Zn/Cd) transporter
MNEPSEQSANPHAITAGLRISLFSLMWTLLAGGAAIEIGISNKSLVLIAFGSLSGLDAIGSGALVVHFRHSLAHDAMSHRLENIAFFIITSGMNVLGLVTAGESINRLVTNSGAHSSSFGIALSAASMVVLAILSIKKRQIARRIPSHALSSDGALSAIGAILAFVTLTSTALNEFLHWQWLDPTASLLVAGGAVGLSVFLIKQHRIDQANS